VSGFVHADGAVLRDGSGEPLLLRGVGLGNWLLPEGYMWQLPAPHNSPRRIEALFADLVGDERATEFWRGFRDSFITEADIARIAAEGFNHVRLPINARPLLADPTEFARIDDVINWCRLHGLWVMLDLHGAPGGQTGTNIDDSPNERPELFEQSQYREQTVELWTELAKRYRDEPTVCGYDLLNEPLPDDYQHSYGDRLASLYQDLTHAIRTVDQNHLIVYEGAHWATNWTIFQEVWDSNSMLQFHKYWSPPDLPSIAGYLRRGRELGLPIYMGEGGENHLDWIQTAFQLFDDQGISWNFWPWKKMNTRTSPCSVRLPADWTEIVTWAGGRGPKPGPDKSWAALTELLGLVSLDRCEYRSDLVSALLRRAPVRLAASGFTFRGPGISYGTTTATPLSTFRADDQVTIRTADGTEPDFAYRSWNDAARPHLTVELARGDWVTYEVNVAAQRDLTITADCTGDVIVELDGSEVSLGRPQPVAAGEHTLRVEAAGTSATLTAVDIR
jgi:endoglucanase